MIRIVIIDDHKLLTEVLSEHLNDNNDFDVIASFNDGNKFLQYFHNFPGKFDIVLLDISMPGTDGFQILEILQKSNRIKTIILTARVEKWLLDKAVKLGAKGFVSKSVPSEELFKAINKVFNGYVYLCSETLKIVYGGEAERTSDEILELTEKEAQLVKLICKGIPSQEVADQLNITVNTLKTHKRNIFRKIGVNNNIGLINYAYKNELV